MRKKLNDRQRKLKAEKRELKKAEAEADRLWHKAVLKKYGWICFFDGTGKEAKEHKLTTQYCHHFQPKSKYPETRYIIENGVPVCWPCHYKMEKFDPSMRDLIIQKRGLKWLEELQAVKPMRSFENIDYYKNTISKLEEYTPNEL